MTASYGNQGLYEDGKKWILKLHKKKNIMSLQEKIWADEAYAEYFESPYEAIKYIKQLQLMDDQSPVIYFNLGLQYHTIFQYDKAIPEFEKALEIYDKLDSKPWWVFDYTLLGYSYHKTGQYKKEKKLYRKADQDFPDDPSLSYMHAVLSLSEGDTITANKYIEKYISVRRENSWSEAAIAYNLGEIYSEAGNLEKAEQYHRKELSLEPQNAFRIYDLAWFLIDKDRNINEGLELIDKALELRPNYHLLLDCKGWGLYKQGKYKEALELLEKSRDLSPYYRHSVYLHIQEVKKAIANQKTSN